jgi:hypothetical protein
LPVHDLNVTRNRNVTSLDGCRTGCRKLHALRAFAFHLEGNLLDVEDDVGDIFANAGKRREFVQDVFDLDRRDRGALQRREQYATQRVAECQAKATLERLGDEGCFTLRIAARLEFEGVGLLQFLPVLNIDGHGLPLGCWVWTGFWCTVRSDRLKLV